MMKSQLQNPFPPDVERTINEIVRDDARYSLTEMLSVHRENLVVPVKLLFRNGEIQSTFSRNVSPVGICLIGDRLIEEDQIVDLEIYRLHGPPIKLTSDVRWCKPFGTEWFMSGWKFLALRR